MPVSRGAAPLLDELLSDEPLPEELPVVAAARSAVGTFESVEQTFSRLAAVALRSVQTLKAASTS